MMKLSSSKSPLLFFWLIKIQFHALISLRLHFLFCACGLDLHIKPGESCSWPVSPAAGPQWSLISSPSSRASLTGYRQSRVHRVNTQRCPLSVCCRGNGERNPTARPSAQRSATSMTQELLKLFLECAGRSVEFLLNSATELLPFWKKCCYVPEIPETADMYFEPSLVEWSRASVCEQIQAPNSKPDYCVI